MTLFISEVCSNHNGSLDRCLAFVDKSAEIGCNAVKFQLFKIRKLFSSEVLADNPKILDRENWELPAPFLPILAERCKSKGIQFGCTPFYLEAVGELYPYVDFYKIASYELLWTNLLTACAETKKPIMISTGMATLDEVKQAVFTLREAGCTELTLMHCVSAYPTPTSDCNLAALETMRSRFECPIGWSDHTVEPGIIYRAIHRWGALTVEFHLDLDGQGYEYSIGHCWLPEQIQPVIQAVHRGLSADGNGAKTAAPSELKERAWRRDPQDGLRPLHATRQLGVPK